MGRASALDALMTLGASANHPRGSPLRALIGPGVGRTFAIIGVGLLLGGSAALALGAPSPAGPVTRVPSVAASTSAAATTAPAASPPPGVSGTAVANATLVKLSGPCRLATAFSDRFQFVAADGALVLTQLSNGHVTRGTIQPNGEFTTSGDGQGYRGRITGTVVEGQHTYTATGCNEVYGMTGQLGTALLAGGGGTPAVSASIVASPGNQSTGYVVEMANPGEAQLSYQWSSSNTCGGFTGSGPRAVWQHPHPPCSEEPTHPGTVQVRIAGPGVACVVSYPSGSAPGRGPTTTCGGSGQSTFAPLSPSPSGSLVPGVGGGAVTGGGGIPGGAGAGGIVIGGGLVVFGVAIQLRRKCDCGQHERALRAKELQIADREEELEALGEWLDDAWDALVEWWRYEADLKQWLVDYEPWSRQMRAAIASWQAHVAFLRSLMGPLGVAGRDRYDTRPHPGWVQVSATLWANSEEAAKAARTAVAVAEMLAGGLTTLAGGAIGYMGALEAAEIALRQARQTELDMVVEYFRARSELRRAQVAIPRLEELVFARMEDLEDRETELERLKEEREALLAALHDCFQKAPPQCPPGSAAVELMDLMRDPEPAERPEGQAPAPPPAVPGPPPAVGTGARTTASPERPADAAPPAPPTPPPAPAGDGEVILTREQQAEVQRVREERQRTRTEIEELERKEDLTTAERERLVELRANERDQDIAVHNSIVRAHNSNVEHARREERRRQEEEERAEQRLSGTDVKRIDALEARRERLRKELAELEAQRKGGTGTADLAQAVEAKRIELKKLNREIADAQREAVKRATATVPAPKPAEPSTAPPATTPDPWDPPAAPEPAATTAPAPPPELAPEDQTRILHKEHRVDELERELVSLARKDADGTITEPERARLADVRAQYRAELTDLVTDTNDSLERARQTRETAPPTAPPAAPPARTVATEKEYRRLREQTPDPGTGISPAARRAAGETRRRLEELDRERAAHATRLRELEAQPTRTPEEEAERVRLTQRVAYGIPEEEARLRRELLTRYPELARTPRPPAESQRPRPPADEATAARLVEIEEEIERNGAEIRELMEAPEGSQISEEVAATNEGLRRRREADEAAAAERETRITVLRERNAALREEQDALLRGERPRRVDPATQARIAELERERDANRTAIQEIEEGATRRIAEEQRAARGTTRAIVQDFNDAERDELDRLLARNAVIESQIAALRQPPAPPPPTTVEELLARLERELAEELRAVADATRARVVAWVAEHVGVVDPEHPLVAMLTDIGVGLGDGELDALLGRITTTIPREAFALILLELGDRLDPEHAPALLQGAYSLVSQVAPDATWGAIGNDRALRTRLADRIADLALASRDLDSLAPALENYHALGGQRGSRAAQLVTVIREVFPTSFSATEAIDAFDANARPLPEKARDLVMLEVQLRSLLDMTGDENVRAALEQIHLHALTIASMLDGLVTTAMRDAETAGLAQEAAKRLYEKVRDARLTGGIFTLWTYSGATPEEERIFDEVLPGWRSWLRHESRTVLSSAVDSALGTTFGMEGEYAARELTEPLRERWQRLGGATRQAGARVADLEQLQLMLRTGQLGADERRTAFRSAFRAARTETERYEADLREARVADGESLGRLTALRERQESTQALALGGDVEAIRAELDAIRLELNGWDEDRARPGHTLTERIRHQGLYERAQELDPERGGLTSAGADQSGKLTEARLVRERIAFLQQRRVDLMLLAPTHFSYASLQMELQQDMLIWRGRKPWDELAWLSRDATSEPVFQEARAALLYETPMLAWQMASAQDDPQGFARFLTTLQESKVHRGEATFRAYMDTPWYRRGWWNQTRRILDASATFQQMYEVDETLLFALRSMSRKPVEALRPDLRETLRRHGFVETHDGHDRYVVPTRFRFDPIAVGEHAALRDWTDELLNASSAAQLVSTYVVGGFAGSLGRLWSLKNAGMAATFVSQVAIEATAFITLEGVVHGGNPFHVIAGNGTWSGLGKDWLHTAVILGGLHALGPLAEAFEAAGVRGVRSVLRGRSVAPRASSARGLERFFEQGLHSGARLSAEAAWMLAVGRLYGEPLSLESLTRAVFAIGVMRATGAMTDAHAGAALEHASRLSALRRGSLEYFGTRAQEIFERARADRSRTELNEHERAQLAELRERTRQGTGGLDLTADFGRIESALARQLGVRMGETAGGWRDLATDPARQTERYGAPLAEALDAAGAGGRTFAGETDAATRAFKEQHWTKFKALVGFMYEAGRWVSVKGEMHTKHRALADALFRARRAWSDHIRERFSATTIGNVSDMRNDCDFNFSLGTGDAFDPVPRMRAAREWTHDRVREALEDLGYSREQIDSVDHELLFETNSYTDPAILHLYTRLPADLQPEVIATLTRDSVAVVRYVFEHRMHHLAPELRQKILSELAPAEGVRTPEQIAADLGIRGDWTVRQTGGEELLERQSALFKEYQALREPVEAGTASAADRARFAEVVKQISEIQMLVNVYAEGAYPVPAAGLVTVSIKEAVLEGQVDMRMVKSQVKELKAEIGAIQREIEGLYRERLEIEDSPTRPGRADDVRLRTQQFDEPIARLRERLADRQRVLRALERAYEEQRLETIKELTPDEALQSVLGDLVFFWHMAEAASHSLDPYDVVMRYEVSKYAARLLEVASVFGMPPSSGVARLLRIATKIYKTKEPWSALSFDRPLEAQRAMRNYFEALQEASAEIVRFLLPRTSLGARSETPTPEAAPDVVAELEAMDLAVPFGEGGFGTAPSADPHRTQRLGEWMERPVRGPGSLSPESLDASRNFVNMLTAERLLQDASEGRLHGATVSLREVVDNEYRRFRRAFAEIREGLEREGPNYWEHFDAEAAEYLQGKMDVWNRTNKPLPAVEEWLDLARRNGVPEAAGDAPAAGAERAPEPPRSPADPNAETHF